MPAPSAFNELATRPDWLLADEQDIRARMPEVNVKIIHQDELPHTATLLGHMDQCFSGSRADLRGLDGMLQDRVEAYTAICHANFDAPTANYFIASYIEYGSANNITASVDMDVSLAYFKARGTWGGQMSIYRQDTPIRNMLVTLPLSHTTSEGELACALGLSRYYTATPHAFLPHRAFLQHEIGHAMRRIGEPHFFTDWHDELTADRNAINSELDKGNEAEAQGLLEYRLLANFISDIHPLSIKYWNTQAQQALQDNTIAHKRGDVAGMLEVKLRTASWLKRQAGLPQLPARDTVLIDHALMAHSFAPLRACFSRSEATPESQKHHMVLFHALEAVVTADQFTHPEAGNLATQIHDAAIKHLPRVLSDRKCKQYLRAKPYPV